MKLGIKIKVSFSAHECLYKKIQASERGFPEWLWSHGKWKVNNMIHEIFLLQDKFRKLDFRERGLKSNQIFIRMPNWLGDVIMALPVIRAIRKGRPDARISLLCKIPYVDLLKVYVSQIKSTHFRNLVGLNISMMLENLT